MIGQGPSRKEADSFRHTCEFCNQVIEPLSQSIGDKVFYFKDQCQCDAATKERANRERLIEDEFLKDKYRDYIKRAGGIHTGRYSRMTFEDWDIARHAKAQKHLNDVVEFCTTYNHERNLLWLWGEYGTGKTHLALAALRKLVWDEVVTIEKADGYRMSNPTLHFTEWVIHCSKVQQSWDKESDEDEGRLWRVMNSVMFLAIDDIDKRMPSEWAMGKLYEVLHHRYMNEKLTIITANHSLSQLDNVWTQRGGYVADIGSAILSRITGQLWAEVEIVGGDQRAR